MTSNTSPRNSLTQLEASAPLVSDSIGHHRSHSLNAAQQIIHCEKQPHESAAISLPRSDGATHDLTNLSTSQSISDVVFDAHKAQQLGSRTSDKKHEHDNGKISVSRSDGIHHDIVSVFKNIAPDADADSIKLQAAREKSIGRIVLPQRALSTSMVSQTKLQGTPKFARPTAPGFFPSSVRIVHISDTHQFLVSGTKNLYLPHGDILVHSGNFTNYGTKQEYRAFNAWLGSVSHDFHYRIVCIGARDVKEFGNNWGIMKKMLNHATHVLCHSDEVVLGIRFYGAPWHWGHRGNYQIRLGAPLTTTGRFNEIPEGIQVLITHGPAADVLDAPSAPGSKELAEAIRRVKPSVHMHGHAKGSHGVVFPFAHSPLVVNSAMCDPDRTVLYAAPHVIKATQITGTSSNSFAQQNGYAEWTFTIDSLVG